MSIQLSPDGMQFDTGAFASFLRHHVEGQPSFDAAALQRLATRGHFGYGDLFEAGVLAPDALANAIAAYHALPRVGDAPLIFNAGLFANLSTRFLRNAWLFPYIAEGEICIAAADPTRTEEIDAVRLALETLAPLRIAGFDTLTACFEQLQANGAKPAHIAVEATSFDETAGDDIERLQDLASGAPIVQAVDGMLEAALVSGATDIHVEPTRDGARVRLRVDGILRVHETLPAQMARGVISRIKILSGLNIAERRLPQDGRARVRIGTTEADIRVATTPTLHGEGLVARLLVKDARILDLSRLGMGPADLRRLEERLADPHGLVIVAGPTGSGKTTTLTAALAALNTPERKIMTIEDPIEYQIAGINQTQVKPSIALTFATALRSFLRHDPDVLMVGEMRDADTASIGIQAALTGHLVLTTLHTNSAADAVTRLLDLKVESFLLNSALRCIVGQRLVRKLCVHCREAMASPPAEALDYLVDGRLKAAASPSYFRATGCQQCGQTGYRGRVGIFEVLTVDGEMRSLIRAEAPAQDIEKAAIAHGMTTMLQDGFAKVGNGVTSFSEVMRATA